jgi:hypothetical protein
VWSGQSSNVASERCSADCTLRPLGETFHDFLDATVKWTFGEEWWKHQLALPADRQHVVVQWERAACELRTRPAERIEPDGTRSRRASGRVWSLLQLGYDLYCLQAKNTLPTFLVDRMQTHQKFQDARYEIVAAAIMQRAGFDVQFLDERQITEKHCELIATDRKTGTRAGVEAKSRVRPGVMNAPSASAPSAPDVRGFANLLRKAKKQAVADLPLLVFLDVNVPWSPDVKGFDKQWITDLRDAIPSTPTPEKPERFAGLFATNFAGHYASPDERQIHPEWATIIPQHAQVPLHPVLLLRIDETVRHYSRIPLEV